MRVLMIAPQPFLQPRGTPVSVYKRLMGLSLLGHRVDLPTCHLGTSVEIPGASVFRTPHLYDMHSSLPKQLRNLSLLDYWPFVKLLELLEVWFSEPARLS
jgi:hypothetical protein